MSVSILIGDCREKLRELPDNSVDSVVCDPPYHLTSIVKRFGAENAAPCKVGKTGAYARASKGFMGQTWDGGDVAFQPETWAEVLRVLKPGGHLVAFSGTRTYHRMAVAIEDAGFEVRDMIAWHYGSGFPKSHDVAKGIDGHLKVDREVVGTETLSNDIRGGALLDVAHGTVRPALVRDKTVATSPEAKEWEGWGTALKPATEPICLARKPLSEKSIAANVLKWGTGALNIDGCRIGMDEAEREVVDARSGAGFGTVQCAHAGREEGDRFKSHAQGRWPANLCHDGSDEVVTGFPDAGGSGKASGPTLVGPSDRSCMAGGFGGTDAEPAFYGDSGSAARFFYCAKATTDERGEGNNHPTVKPVALMRWLVRLVTPVGGTVLDPFMGSGSTLIAADAEQFNAIGCELSPEYAAIAEKRIRNAAGMFADVKVAA